MTFKKQYTKEDFLNVLSSNWQKTREIAEKIGCKNDNVTKNLLQMPDVEWQWTKGGKQGTREWRLKEGKEIDVLETLNSNSKIFELVGKTGSGKTFTAIKIGKKFIEDGKTVLYLARKNDISDIPGIFNKELMVNNLKQDESRRYLEWLRVDHFDLIIMDEITGTYPERMWLYRLLDKMLWNGTKVIAIRQNNKPNATLIPIFHDVRRVINESEGRLIETSLSNVDQND